MMFEEAAEPVGEGALARGSIMFPPIMSPAVLACWLVLRGPAGGDSLGLRFLPVRPPVLRVLVGEGSEERTPPQVAALLRELAAPRAAQRAAARRALAALPPRYLRCLEARLFEGPPETRLALQAVVLRLRLRRYEGRPAAAADAR